MAATTLGSNNVNNTSFGTMGKSGKYNWKPVDYEDQFGITMYDGLLVAMHKNRFIQLTASRALQAESISFYNQMFGSINLIAVSPGSVVPTYPSRLIATEAGCEVNNNSRFFDKTLVLHGMHHLDKITSHLPDINKYDAEIINAWKLMKSKVRKEILTTPSALFIKDILMDEISTELQQESNEIFPYLFNNFFTQTAIPYNEFHENYIIYMICNIKIACDYILNTEKHNIVVNSKLMQVKVDNPYLAEDHNENPCFIRTLACKGDNILVGSGTKIANRLFSEIGNEFDSEPDTFKDNMEPIVKEFYDSLIKGLIISKDAPTLKNFNIIKMFLASLCEQEYCLPVATSNKWNSYKDRVDVIKSLFAQKQFTNKKISRDLKRADAIAGSIISVARDTSCSLNALKERNCSKKSEITPTHLDADTCMTNQDIFKQNMNFYVAQNGRNLPEEEMERLSFSIIMTQSISYLPTITNILEHIFHSDYFASNSESSTDESVDGDIQSEKKIPIKDIKTKPYIGCNIIKYNFTLIQAIMASFFCDPFNFKRFFIAPICSFLNLHNGFRNMLHPCKIELINYNKDLNNITSNNYCTDCENYRFSTGTQHCLDYLLYAYLTILSNAVVSECSIKHTFRKIQDILKQRRKKSNDFQFVPKAVFTLPLREAKSTLNTTGNYLIRDKLRRHILKKKPVISSVPSDQQYEHNINPAGVQSSSSSSATTTNNIISGINDDSDNLANSSTSNKTSNQNDSDQFFDESVLVNRVCRKVMSLLGSRGCWFNPLLSKDTSMQQTASKWNNLLKEYLTLCDNYKTDNGTKIDKRFLSEGLSEDKEKRILYVIQKYLKIDVSNILSAEKGGINFNDIEDGLSEKINDHDPSEKNNNESNRSYRMEDIFKQQETAPCSNEDIRTQQSSNISPPSKRRKLMEKTDDLLKSIIYSLTFKNITVNPDNLHACVSSEIATLLQDIKKRDILVKGLLAKDCAIIKQVLIQELFPKIIISYLNWIQELITNVHNATASVLNLTQEELDSDYINFIQYHDRVLRIGQARLDLGHQNDSFNRINALKVLFYIYRHEASVDTSLIAGDKYTTYIEQLKRQTSPFCADFKGPVNVHLPILKNETLSLSKEPSKEDIKYAVSMLSALKVKIAFNVINPFNQETKSKLNHEKSTFNNTGDSQEDNDDEFDIENYNNAILKPVSLTDKHGTDQLTGLNELYKCLRDPTLKFTNVTSGRIFSSKYDKLMINYIESYIKKINPKSRAVSAILDAICSTICIICKNLLDNLESLQLTHQCIISDLLKDIMIHSSKYMLDALQKILRSNYKLSNVLYLYILCSEIYCPASDRLLNVPYLDQCQQILFGLVCAMMRLHFPTGNKNESQQQCPLTYIMWSYISDEGLLLPSTCDVMRKDTFLMTSLISLNSFKSQQKHGGAIYTTLRGGYVSAFNTIMRDFFTPRITQTKNIFLICKPLCKKYNADDICSEKTWLYRMQNCTMNEFIDNVTQNFARNLNQISLIYKNYISISTDHIENITREEIIQAYQTLHQLDPIFDLHQCTLFEKYLLEALFNNINNIKSETTGSSDTIKDEVIQNVTETSKQEELSFEDCLILLD